MVACVGGTLLRIRGTEGPSMRRRYPRSEASTGGRRGMGLFSRMKVQMPTSEEALRGREAHAGAGAPRGPRHRAGAAPPGGGRARAVRHGLLLGAERVFWQAPGVISTSVGYAGGYTPNPSYEEVCSGRTGHNEVVRVVFDPAVTSYDALLKLFWENTTRPRGLGRGTTSGRRTGRASTHSDAQRLRQASLTRLRAPTRRGRLRLDHDGDRTDPGSSSTPRTTTSSTSRRSRTATAGSVGPGSAARSASPRPTDPRQSTHTTRTMTSS